MSFQFIEGGAGTGKTTTVIARLREFLVVSPLSEHQRVLALTKMHGSRRRIHDRLRSITGLNGRFESVTLDSFAWRVLCRWRSLDRSLGHMDLPADFNASCDRAGCLLEMPVVQSWVAASFPVVIVDELQDSKMGQLRLLQGLSGRCTCIAAGDPFQDLEGDETCQSIEWARRMCTPTVLSVTHRTTNAGLIGAASELRSANAVTVSNGFALEGGIAPALAAWKVAATLSKWRALGSVAVISPVKARSSPFVRSVVDRVNDPKRFATQWWPTGSFNLRWEAAEDDDVELICRALSLPDDEQALVRPDELSFSDEPRALRLRDWMRRQRSLRGRVEFTAGDIRLAVKSVIQQGRSFAGAGDRRLAAMSIHQAKNREFDRVIVLWPYEVSGSDERKRRLAYNAITRARHEALVIVQGEGREKQSPFVPEQSRVAEDAVGVPATVTSDAVKPKGKRPRRKRSGS